MPNLYLESDQLVLINRADCVFRFFYEPVNTVWRESEEDLCIFLDVQYLYPHFVLSDCSVIVMLHLSP